MHQHPDLFHALANLNGCLYISDLKRLPKEQLLAAIQRLATTDYPARQWVGLLCYLSDAYQWSDPQVQAFTAEFARSQLIAAIAT